MINEQAKIEIGGLHDPILRMIYLNYTPVIENNDPKKSKEQLVLISNYQLILFKPKFMRKLSMHASYTYNNLKVLELRKDQIYFEFDKDNYLITLPSPSAIFENVCQSIINILTDDSLPKFIPVQKIKRKPNSIFSRYKFLCFLNEKKPDKKVLSFLNKTKAMQFTFEEIREEVSRDLDIFMEALENLECKRLEFPRFETPQWDKLAKLLAQNQYINQIVLNGPISASMEEVYNVLEKTKTTNVACLTFQDSEATPEFFSLITKFMKLPQITTLSLISFLKDYGDVPAFTDIVYKNRPYEFIDTLEIKYMPRINYKMIHQCFPHLDKIEFSNCKISLANYLDYISTWNDKGVANIKLEGNNADFPIHEALSLPPCIIDIDVSDIYWTSRNLITFLKIIAKYRNSAKNFKVGLNKIKMDTKGWVQFNSELKNIEEPQIRHIFWKGNMISPEIIEFFNRCRLTLLTFGDNFDDDDASVLLFRDYLIRQKYLQTLVYQEQERPFNLKSELIKGIRYNRSINYLSLLNTQFTHEDIQMLGLALLENCNIGQLSINTLQEHSTKTINKFWKIVVGRGTPLKLVGYDIKKSDDPELFELSKSVKDGNPNIIPPDESLRISNDRIEEVIASFHDSDEKLKKIHGSDSDMLEFPDEKPSEFKPDDAINFDDDFDEKSKSEQKDTTSQESQDNSEGSASLTPQTSQEMLLLTYEGSQEFTLDEKESYTPKFETKMQHVPLLDVDATRKMLEEKFNLKNLRRHIKK